MKNRNFIIISLNPWFTPLSSTSKHIALELAKQNKVLYVNPPLDRKTLLTKRKDPLLQRHMNVLQGKEEDLVEIGPNLWNYYPPEVLASINWMPYTGAFSLFNRINNKRFARSIQSVVKRMGFEDFILINDKDLFRGFYLKELLKPEVYLYYDRDYILGVDYWRKHGLKLEPRLAAKSDVIVTHSDHFMELLKPYNPNIHNVGSGIDITLFDGENQHPLPEELRSLPHPILGYVGALTALRLDINLIVRIAKERPRYTIVLLGPEDESFRNSMLHQLDNVHFLGRKPLSEVPAYIQHFDVCLNPQLINDITIGNYPLKIDEYLAMGKPVVATRTKGMKLFEPYTYLAEPGESHAGLIDMALAEDNVGEQSRRIAFARSHSWKNVLNNVYEAIEYTLANKNGCHQQN